MEVKNLKRKYGTGKYALQVDYSQPRTDGARTEIGPAVPQQREYISDDERNFYQRLEDREWNPRAREEDLMDAIDLAMLAAGGLSAAKYGVSKMASSVAPRLQGTYFLQELREKVPINKRLVVGGKNPLAMRVNDLRGTGTFVESADELYPELGYSLDRLENAYRQSIPFGKGNPLYMTEMQELRGGSGQELTDFGKETLPAILEGADVAGANAARKRLLKQIPFGEAQTLEQPYHPRFDWYRPKPGDEVLRYPTAPTTREYPRYGKVRK